MRSSKSYRRVSVKDVCVASLLARASGKGDQVPVVGLDIGKAEIVAVVRWGQGDFERPWSVSNPSQIGLLIGLLQRLGVQDGGLQVSLESTGTYGEAVRRALTLAGFAVRRVSGKAVSDYAEIFDGVPSQHDGKDAAMIAELSALGKSASWAFCPRSELEEEMAHLVLRLDAFRRQQTVWQGRLEGLLARHWPECTGLLGLSSLTLLELLAEYGGPAALLADSGAAERLRSWSRGQLSRESVEKLLASAGATRGVPASAASRQWMRESAAEALSARSRLKQYEKALQELVSEHASIQRLSSAVGVVTMCVLWSSVGDPRNYDSAGAYVKAFGLNLTEFSSGRHVGELSISKRGPSLARRWLFFAALRAVQQGEVKVWYEGKQSRDRRGKMKGLVGVMRKLCRSIWHVSQTEESFAWAKVFPGQPLAVAASPPERASAAGSVVK